MTPLATAFGVLTPTDAMPVVFVNGEMRGAADGVLRDDTTIEKMTLRITRDVTIGYFIDDTTRTCPPLEIDITHNAKVTFVVISFVAHSFRADVRLGDERASIECAALIFSDAGHVTHDVVISHRARETVSTQTVRCIATGDARIDWHGHVDVGHGAAGSTVRQDNKNLLLSEGAHIAARPELDIEIDDVTASHGSATGSLDPEALLYLTSRGISTEEATRLLTLAFAEVTLARLPAEVRELAITRFSEKISLV